MFKYLFMKIVLRIYKNKLIFTLNIYFLQDKLIWFIKQFPSIILIKTRRDK